MSVATVRFICGLVLVALVFLSFTLESTEARYMPTRADPVRREQIRELIKAVLDLAPADGAHNSYGAYEYGAPSGLKGLERND